jgi:hypothetical protein
MNILDQVIEQLRSHQFAFQAYNHTADPKALVRTIIKQLTDIKKYRKKTTNLSKVFKKIVQIYITVSEFREGIIIIIKEILIRYLNVVGSKSAGIKGLIKNRFHEPTKEIIQTLSDVFGYIIIIHEIRGSQIVQEKLTSKVSYKNKQLLNRSEDFEFFENIYQDGKVVIFRDTVTQQEEVYELFVDKNYESMCKQIIDT